MKYFLEASGIKFEVHVDSLGEDSYILSFEGDKYEADFLEVDGFGQYAVKIGGDSYAASIEEIDSNNLRVTIAGKSFSIAAFDEQELVAKTLTSSRSRIETLKSSMPGIVVSVEVEVGDCVELGQGLVVLEAMKMQNELKASGEGLVEEVFVAPGDAVSANQPLLRLTPLLEDS